MLDPQSRLCPNREEVAAKVMDGEAIMINLSNGTYYSMDGVGGLIWDLIAREHTLGDIVSAISVHYDASSEQVWADLQRLADELLQEELVRVAAGSVSRGGDAAPVAPDRRQPYASPVLNVYRDMAELLALDPPMPGLGPSTW
jgi:hypothetical protein